MFEHGKTKKVYYSIREKINYYKQIIAGKKEADVKTRRKAKLRLKTLNRLNQRTFDTPTLIVTDDKHFGNTMSKPRGAVVVGVDNKNRLITVPIYKRSTTSIILDKHPDREIHKKVKCIDKSDVYEIKNIPSMKNLTKYDINKIKEVYK